MPTPAPDMQAPKVGDQPLGPGYKKGTGKGGATDGVHLVGEKGEEMMVKKGAHVSVIPHAQTEQLIRGAPQPQPTPQPQQPQQTAIQPPQTQPQAPMRPPGYAVGTPDKQAAADKFKGILHGSPAAKPSPTAQSIPAQPLPGLGASVPRTQQIAPPPQITPGTAPMNPHAVQTPMMPRKSGLNALRQHVIENPRSFPKAFDGSGNIKPGWINEFHGNLPQSQRAHWEAIANGEPTPLGSGGMPDLGTGLGTPHTSGATHQAPGSHSWEDPNFGTKARFNAGKAAVTQGQQPVPPASPAPAISPPSAAAPGEMDELGQGPASMGTPPGIPKPAPTPAIQPPTLAKAPAWDAPDPDESLAAGAARPFKNAASEVMANATDAKDYVFGRKPEREAAANRFQQRESAAKGAQVDVATGATNDWAKTPIDPSEIAASSANRPAPWLRGTTAPPTDYAARRQKMGEIMDQSPEPPSSDPNASPYTAAFKAYDQASGKTPASDTTDSETPRIAKNYAKGTPDARAALHHKANMDVMKTMLSHNQRVFGTPRGAKDEDSGDDD